VLFRCILFSAAAFCVQASAFQLNDHELITRQAYAEFIQCYPGAGAVITADRLVQADLAEDLDLVSKQIFYAHYFNPHRKLNLMWRSDSSVRVHDLDPLLLQCRAGHADWSNLRYSQAIGGVVHHLQDMAVPAHVVPVSHSLWDGFESYEFKADISSGLSCADLRAGIETTLDDLLVETSEQTLLSIQNWRIPAVDSATHSPRVLSGSDFWQEGSGNRFGHYGPLGNTFGISTLGNGTEGFLVENGEYAAFKQQQMRLAVRATLMAMSWTLGPIL
jgi:hypothetical protein